MARNQSDLGVTDPGKGRWVRYVLVTLRTQS